MENIRSMFTCGMPASRRMADGFGRLLHRVLAAEGFQDVRGERLDAERNARHAEFAEEPGFFHIEGGRIRFQRDLIEFA